jgi:hypothetical protein
MTEEFDDAPEARADVFRSFYGAVACCISFFRAFLPVPKRVDVTIKGRRREAAFAGC